jgi:uncharacterized protein YaiE (UPF0345 family)
MVKSNDYFEGRVKSLSLTAEGGRATIGVIEAGEYEFATSSIEVMRIVEGVLDAKLPGAEYWTSYAPGSSFTVPAGKKFSVRSKADAAYLCLYR